MARNSKPRKPLPGKPGWRDVPAHEHFQKWTKAGILSKLWKLCLLEYDRCKGIYSKWQSLDSVTVSAPVKGGIKRARTRPTGENSAQNATSSSMVRESPWE